MDFVDTEHGQHKNTDKDEIISDLKEKVANINNAISRLFDNIIDLRVEMVRICLQRDDAKSRVIELERAILVYGGCQFDCDKMTSGNVLLCSCGFMNVNKQEDVKSTDL